MSWDEVKNEKEGFVRVRKSDDRALVGRLRKENDDDQAKGYIELKIDDLGFEGGGGPHTHSEYANKTHTHDEYLTDLPDHTHPELDGGGAAYDDTQIKHDIKVEHDKNTQQDQRIDNMATQGNTNTQEIKKINDHINALDSAVLSKAPADHTHDDLGGGEHEHTEYADAQALADHLANHPSGGDGDSYDDTEVRGLIQGNTDALESKSDVTHTHDTTHTHEEYLTDLTHDHDGEYQPAGDYATNDALTTGLAGKSDTGHTHDVDLTHNHEGMVVSDSVGSIVRISADEFALLVDKDPTTLYLVV